LVDVDEVGVGEAVGLDDVLSGHVVCLGEAPDGVAGLHVDRAGADGLTAGHEEGGGPEGTQ